MSPMVDELKGVVVDGQLVRVLEWRFVDEHFDTDRDFMVVEHPGAVRFWKKRLLRAHRKAQRRFGRCLPREARVDYMTKQRSILVCLEVR